MDYTDHKDGRIDVWTDHHAGTIFTKDELGMKLERPFFITSGGIDLYPNDLKEIAKKLEEFN